MNKEKEYPISNDLDEIMSEVISLENLRDAYIKLRWFGYRLAAKSALKAATLKNKFWIMVYKEYPELSDYHLNYNRVTMSVKRTGKRENL